MKTKKFVNLYICTFGSLTHSAVSVKLIIMLKQMFNHNEGITAPEAESIIFVGKVLIRMHIAQTSQQLQCDYVWASCMLKAPFLFLILLMLADCAETGI